MSGGDLDGDKFFVCWDEDLIPPRTEEPTSYQGKCFVHCLEYLYVDFIFYPNFCQHKEQNNCFKCLL